MNNSEVNVLLLSLSMGISIVIKSLCKYYFFNRGPKIEEKSSCLLLRFKVI